MRKDILKELFEKYIEGTELKSIVTDESVSLCRLTRAVSKVIEYQEFSKVYISTRVLKHLYDSKPAEEFHFLIDNLHKIIKYPNYIYENKSGKRGSFIFTKEIKQDSYLCSIEKTGSESEVNVVTSFRVRKRNYLKDYNLLWSWRNDNPSS